MQGSHIWIQIGTHRHRDVGFDSQSRSDWPQMGQIRDFFRSYFSTFWLTEPKCTQIWSEKRLGFSLKSAPCMTQSRYFCPNTSFCGPEKSQQSGVLNYVRSCGDQLSENTAGQPMTSSTWRAQCVTSRPLEHRNFRFCPKVGQDWLQMGQFREFSRSKFSTFWLTSQNVLKFDLKKSGFVRFNLIQSHFQSYMPVCYPSGEGNLRGSTKRVSQGRLQGREGEKNWKGSRGYNVKKTTEEKTFWWPWWDHGW